MSLNVLDVDVDKPDEKSIMTYVAQFVKAYPDPGSTVPVQVESGANKVMYLVDSHRFSRINPHESLFAV